jgi:hypothetical protein
MYYTRKQDDIDRIIYFGLEQKNASKTPPEILFLTISRKCFLNCTLTFIHVTDNTSRLVFFWSGTRITSEGEATKVLLIYLKSPSGGCP